MNSAPRSFLAFALVPAFFFLAAFYVYPTVFNVETSLTDLGIFTLRKGGDWIVANNVADDGIMGGDENQVLLVYPQGLDAWPRISKAEVAARLAARIAEDLA